MRRISITMSLLMLAWVAGGYGPAKHPSVLSLAASDRVSETTRRAPEDPSLLASAQSHIAAREYWATPTDDGLQAPNRVHGLRSFFTPKGVRVLDRTAAGSPNLLGLSLVGLGRGEARGAVPAGEITHVEGRIEITRKELGLVEWYVNSPEGLEQGFTLSERPVRSSEDLALALTVSDATASLRGESVVLTTDAGRKLEYGKLAVLDAKGRLLAARFEVPQPDRISILVDDRKAVYPIVIDPLLTATDDARLEPDQAEALLGYGVAFADDVNGDGYADVIVGAQAFDAGEVGEGAAFVFHGGPGGVGDGNPSNADRLIQSNQTGAQLGLSVAGAGDVNGDGYADVIVGAHVYDDPQVDEGAAFLFLGSAAGIIGSTPATAHARFASDQADSSFGLSVASAGDVNGDGYADVIVGAERYDAGQIDEGAAFVFLGSAAGIADGNPTTAHARFESNQEGNIFLTSRAAMGYSVASAGDVNADGFDDVIVGAKWYDSGTVDEGAAFVFHGSVAGLASGNPATANARLESNQAALPFPPSFGSAVASAGDVDGDGYDDVLVGAPSYSVSGAQSGSAFLFRGSASGIDDGDPTTAHARIEPTVSPAGVGFSLGSGDVNGDGYSDVVVGAPSVASVASLGAAYIYLGSASGIGDQTTQTANRVLGSAEGGNFGAGVASGGDVDGDGYDDVAVGAPRYSAGQTREGSVFVYHGGGTGILRGSSTNAADSRIEGNLSESWMGYSVASAGDVNADGYGDVIVGAPRFDSGEDDEGAAFVFLGSSAGIAATGPATAHAQLESNQFSAQMGSSVSSAGDVNGDGYGDVIVGAYRYTAGEAAEGAAFVFLGSASGIADGNPEAAHAQLESNWAGSELGTSVASAGDVNGDGYGDIIVGAPGFSSGHALEGAAFVFPGSASGIADGNPFTTMGWIESDQDLASLGNSVASAGDVNGDGYGDVIVGSHVYSSGQGAEEGAAFVFHGSPSGITFATPLSAVARIEANQGIARLGWSVASAGDLNADGYDDIVVGAPLYDAGESDEGGVFVFLGSPTGIGDGSPMTADARLESNLSDGHLGYSVSSAGDVNRDGFSDLVVGVPGRQRALTFVGSASGVTDGDPSTAHAVIQEVSNQFAPSLGWSVASAGDVNGDGAGDVVVGATFMNLNQPGELFEGAAYLYLGNDHFDTIGGDSIGNLHGSGRPVRVQQHRSFGSATRIQPGGGSFAFDRFDVELLATSPRGRERAKLQVEACPAGVAFGGIACTTRISATWADLGRSGASLRETISGLASNTTYSWRARPIFTAFGSTQPGIQPIERPGPWVRLQGRAGAGDVRTVPEPGLRVGILIGIAVVASRSRRSRPPMRLQ